MPRGGGLATPPPGTSCSARPRRASSPTAGQIIARKRQWREHVIASASGAHVIGQYVGVSCAGGSLLCVFTGWHNFHNSAPWILSWLPLGTLAALMFLTNLVAIALHASNRRFYERHWEIACETLNFVGSAARNMAVHRANHLWISMRPLTLAASVVCMRFEQRRQLKFFIFRMCLDSLWELSKKWQFRAGGELAFADWELTLRYFAMKVFAGCSLHAWLERRDLKRFLLIHYETDMAMLMELRAAETLETSPEPETPPRPGSDVRGGRRRGSPGGDASPTHARGRSVNNDQNWEDNSPRRSPRRGEGGDRWVRQRVRTWLSESSLPPHYD